MSLSAYNNCILCGRRCGVNRSLMAGACGMSSRLLVARAALHQWEEPPISGTRGSGTIFFSGCSLSCKFCQNADISQLRFGKEIEISDLADMMLSLEESGAHNINFVTPTHYVPSIAEAIRIARAGGLSIPTVYNTGSYDSLEALKILDGLIDVYLPDYKFYTVRTASRYSMAYSYPDVAKDAIAEMYRQVGSPELDDNKIMKRGLIVRILLLPGHVAEAKLSLKYLLETYGDNVYISLMNQYTPMPGMPSPLNRRVTQEEYRQLTDYALKLGLKNGFVQEGGTASESFIPPFDLTGVKV